MAESTYPITDWLEQHMRERLAEIRRRGPKPGYEGDYIAIVDRYERDLATWCGIGDREKQD